MTKHAHTPGPWIYDSRNDGAVVYKEDMGTIANVPDDLIQSEANATLIAAAPELLEALQDLLGDRPNVVEKAGRFSRHHCGRNYGCSDDAPE